MGNIAAIGFTARGATVTVDSGANLWLTPSRLPEPYDLFRRVEHARAFTGNPFC
jgi:hypothetical protein